MHTFFVLQLHSVENGNWQSETKLRDEGLYWTRHICSHVYMGFTKFTTLMHNYLNFFMLFFRFLLRIVHSACWVEKVFPLIFFLMFCCTFVFQNLGSKLVSQITLCGSFIKYCLPLIFCFAPLLRGLNLLRFILLYLRIIPIKVKRNKFLPARFLHLFFCLFFSV